MRAIHSVKAVLFDFGGTLIQNGKGDFLHGCELLLQAAENPQDCTPEKLKELWDELHSRLRRCRGGGELPYGIETPLSGMLRNILAKTPLRFKQDVTELGIVFDAGNFPPRAPTPGMAELLERLNEKGIPTGIISNTTMSAGEMEAAVNKHLGNNRFLFVLTSADYLFTKPAPDMFQIAANKLGLAPADCLYCGDSLVPDVGGATAAGMQAVLYDEAQAEPLLELTYQGKAYRKINHWDVLRERFS